MYYLQIENNIRYSMLPLLIIDCIPHGYWYAHRLKSMENTITHLPGIDADIFYTWKFT